MRVLLVEDDTDLATVIGKGLQQAHLAIDISNTISDAIDHLLVTTYDLVCLDLNLPDGDGIELCHRIYADNRLQCPRRILMLTARDAVTDRVKGLDAGADDYLVKPFDFAELMARIRALTRRHDQIGEVISVMDLEIDIAKFRAQRANKDLNLSGKEFSVLRYLAYRASEVVSTEELLEHCWDANVDMFSSSVRVILSRLRRKLGEPQLIHTIAGVGYRLCEDDS